MSIYNFTDYRAFLKAFLHSLPKRGHGTLSAWSQKFRVSTTLLSQILSGKGTLSLELAESIATEIQLTETETDYFFLLIQFDKAGTASLKKHFKSKIAKAQSAARSLSSKRESAAELPGEIKTLYYSSWMYAAVRNLAVCEGITDIGQIAQRLNLSRSVVSEVMRTLLENSLLVQEKNHWSPGVARTYLPPESPLVPKHHQNWRLRAMQKMELRTAEDLFYTSPMSLSEEVALGLRKHLVDAIEALQKQAAPSASETVRCLNIDWFEY